MNAVVEFSPEKAWQAAVANLELDMSRATFSTWVKPTQLVEFSDDTFVIGCINAYGRDWLTDRLTTTLQRFLTGVLNREAKVRFVVCDQEVDDEEDLAQEENQDQEDDEENPIDLDIHYSSIRNILLEPGRVVRLPVYNLRWLPYVSSQVIFLVMALWQEYYLASGGKGRKGSCKVSVRAEQICQWAGISRAQFFRLLQPGSSLGWFTRKIDTDHEVDKRSGRAKKSSNKYELFETPLTPGDAEDLKTFLLAHGIQDSPQSALQLAINANPKEILQYPVRLPPEDFSKMIPRHLTVQDVIRELVGHRLDGELGNLADQLADRLVTQGDFILVTWYFLKHWLPVLGADAAMFVLVLRDLCYFNDETGEIRDEVWMDGGYEAIANRLGINNPRVVANWLPVRIGRGKRKDELSDRTVEEFSRRQRLQDLLRLFVERTDHRINSEGNYGWKFKVQRVDPLTSQHQTIQQAASSLFVKSESLCVQDELGSWISYLGNDCFETIKTEPMVVLRLSYLIKDCSETLKSILNDCLETLDLQANDCFETLLKILKSFKDSLKDKDTSSTQDSSISRNDPSSQSVAVVTDSEGNWSLDKLLARADKKNQSILIEQEKSAIPFVSWMIHGASQPGIQNPYSLAIAKLKENPGISAGGASDRLAAIPPRELVRLIEHSFSFYSPSDRNWRMLFAEAKKDRIRLLADSLGLVLDIEEETGWISN
ncbi:MAG: DnaA N-terminal domain-containing protein [Bellilinea sp.]